MPSLMTDTRSLPGLIKIFKRLISNFVKVATPLTELKEGLGCTLGMKL